MDDIVDKIKNERRWLERSLLIVEYHSNQQSKFGKARGVKWTVHDTAEQLKLSVGYISEAVKIVRGHIRGLINDKMTREEALKVLRNHD